jgi:hypothetical protein
MKSVALHKISEDLDASFSLWASRHSRSKRPQPAPAAGSLVVRHLARAPDGFLADDPEDVHFHRAWQDANIPGFSNVGYYAVYRGSDCVAVVPYFVFYFPFATMFPDGSLLKRCMNAIGKRGLGLTVACVGHPSSDLGHIHGEISAEVLDAVNRELFKITSLVAYKGFAEDFPLKGFVKAKGLPVGLLTIVGDYWSQLRANARYQLKKKLRLASHLRVEECDSIDKGLAENIYRLYLNTYERAKVKLERLTLDYFIETAAFSKYLLFYEGEHLLGFCQLFLKKPRITLRYVGLDYERSQQYGVYFLLFLEAINVCLREGYAELEVGATSYDYKRHIGCEIMPTWVYYHHANPFANYILGKIKFILEPGASELE